MLAINHDILPKSFFLSGLKWESHEPIAFGGFADVFYGRLGDAPIAIKRVRVRSSIGTSGEAQALQVCPRLLTSGADI